MVILEGRCVNSLASWPSLLGLLNSSNDQDHTTNGFIDVLIGDSFFDLLVSGIEHHEGLIFLTNAGEKGEDIEVTSESLEESLLDLSELDSLWGGSELKGRLSTEDGLGSSFSDIFTEFLPVFVGVLLDSILNLMEDIDSIDHEVLSNVVSEGGWA